MEFCCFALRLNIIIALRRRLFINWQLVLQHDSESFLQPTRFCKVACAPEHCRDSVAGKAPGRQPEGPTSAAADITRQGVRAVSCTGMWTLATNTGSQTTKVSMRRAPLFLLLLGKNRTHKRQGVHSLNGKLPHNERASFPGRDAGSPNQFACTCALL